MAFSSDADTRTPRAPISARSSVTHREKMVVARRVCSSVDRWSHRCPSGPMSRGLMRAGSPTPSEIGSTPSARHRVSYSPLTSPAIRVRAP